MLARAGRVLDQPFGREHVERHDSGSHGEIVLCERRAVHHGLVHAVEDFFIDGSPQQHGPDRHMAAGERLGDQHHVGFDVPMFDRQKPAGAAEPGLNFVGNEQGSVARAKLGGVAR